MPSNSPVPKPRRRPIRPGTVVRYDRRRIALVLERDGDTGAMCWICRANRPGMRGDIKAYDPDDLAAMGLPLGYWRVRAGLCWAGRLPPGAVLGQAPAQLLELARREAKRATEQRQFVDQFRRKL